MQKILFGVVALFLVAAACGKGDKKADKAADDKPAAKKTPPAPAPAKTKLTGDDTTPEGRLANLTAFRDRVCKCTDKACAAAANKELRVWLKSIGQYQMTPKEVAAVRPLFQAFKTCQLKLTGKAMAGTPGPEGATAGKMPEKYAERVKAYMDAAVKALEGHKGDCQSMARAMAKVLTAHSPTLAMMLANRNNRAVKAWTAQQPAMNEKGAEIGKKLGSCANSPQMKAVLARLRGEN